MNRYQIKCQNMVAGPGENHKSLPKKRDGKGRCTKRPYRNSHGIAESKTLRKREARLAARRQAHMTTVNADTRGDGKGYRKPGALR